MAREEDEIHWQQDDKVPRQPGTFSRRALGEMHFPVLMCALAVLSPTGPTDAYRVDLETDGLEDFVPTDFNLDSPAGFVPDNTPSSGPSRNVNSALSVPEEGMSPFQKAGQWKGGKASLQEETPDELVEDIKTILWKLAAADQLGRHSFIRSDQMPQKTNKRACFWKYCVTS